MPCRFVQSPLAVLLCLPLLVAACQPATNPPFESVRLIQADRIYDYPFVNPFAATVVGTPTGYNGSPDAR